MPPPKARVCYICGRQYMLHSFAIHITQCRELFEKREALKPAKERRRCPDDPFLNNQHISSMDADAMNDISFKAFNNSLVPCKNCGRTFLPEKLTIHQHSCKLPQRNSRQSRNTDMSEISLERRMNDAQLNSSQSKSVSFQGDKGVGVERGNTKSMSSDMAQRFAEASFVPAELMQCPSCGRSFNEFSYQK